MPDELADAIHAALAPIAAAMKAEEPKPVRWDEIELSRNREREHLMREAARKEGREWNERVYRFRCRRVNLARELFASDLEAEHFRGGEAAFEDAMLRHVAREMNDYLRDHANA